MRKRHEDDAGWAWVVGGGCYIKGNARMHHYLHSGWWVLCTSSSGLCNGGFVLCSDGGGVRLCKGQHAHASVHDFMHSR